MLRRARHHRRPGPAQRRGQKRRRHGQSHVGGPVRRVHPRQRGRGHDPGGPARRALPGKARGHDLRLLGRPGYDRRARDTSAATLSGIIADEAAIGVVNNKTTAVRLIPCPGPRWATA